MDPSLREGGRVGGRGGKQKDSAGVGRGVQGRGSGVCEEHMVGGGPPAHGERRNLTHHASSLHAKHRLHSRSCLLTHSLRPTHHMHPPGYSTHTHYASYLTLTNVRQLDLQCKHKPAIKAVQLVARGSRTVWWVVIAEPLHQVQDAQQPARL